MCPLPSFADVNARVCSRPVPVRFENKRKNGKQFVCKAQHANPDVSTSASVSPPRRKAAFGSVAKRHLSKLRQAIVVEVAAGL